MFSPATRPPLVPRVRGTSEPLVQVAQAAPAGATEVEQPRDGYTTPPQESAGTGPSPQKLASALEQAPSSKSRVKSLVPGILQESPLVKPTRITPVSMGRSSPLFKSQIKRVSPGKLPVEPPADESSSPSPSSLNPGRRKLTMKETLMYSIPDNITILKEREEYIPTEQEVNAYADYLGFVDGEDDHLRWIPTR